MSSFVADYKPRMTERRAKKFNILFENSDLCDMVLMGYFCGYRIFKLETVGGSFFSRKITLFYSVSRWTLSVV